MSDSGLHLLFDRAPIGMYCSTAAGAFTYVNHSLARMLGYSVDELMAMNVERDIVVDPTTRQRRVAAYSPGMVIDGVADRWRTKDGRVLDIQLWGHVVETANGLSFDASVVDITERNRQRDELIGTTTILDQVVRQMPALWWATDAELRVTRGGGAAEEILGIPPDRYVGMRLAELQSSSPSSVDPETTHRRALAGETVEYDSVFEGKLLTVIVSPQRAHDGAIIGTVGTALDATRTRMVERRMIDAQRAESVGVLAGGLAHDFNNLLVAVIGNADLALRDLPLGIPGRAAIETTRDAGLRAAELTHQLLTVSGRGPAGTTRVYPAAIVDEMLRLTAPTIPASIRVEVDVPASLVLRGDPAQVHQVIANLVANARDSLATGAGPRGCIAIRARQVVHDGTATPNDVLSAPAGTYVLLEVGDDGPGMSAAIRRHVFDPFFTTKEHGHGLGLAAVLGVVRAHGGGMRLISAERRGATFVILWPAASSASIRAASPQPEEPRRTVLVVDDEDLVRDVVARMIEDLGYAAVTARDGAGALELLDTHQLDAVLLDMTMPRMTGADVIAEVRRRRPGLPVILCSGAGRGALGAAAADAYLPKPFRIEALERTLAKLLPL